MAAVAVAVATPLTPSPSSVASSPASGGYRSYGYEAYSSPYAAYARAPLAKQTYHPHGHTPYGAPISPLLSPTAPLMMDDGHAAAAVPSLSLTAAAATTSSSAAAAAYRYRSNVNMPDFPIPVSRALLRQPSRYDEPIPTAINVIGTSNLSTTGATTATTIEHDAPPPSLTMVTSPSVTSPGDHYIAYTTPSPMDQLPMPPPPPIQLLPHSSSGYGAYRDPPVSSVIPTALPTTAASRTPMIAPGAIGASSSSSSAAAPSAAAVQPPSSSSSSAAPPPPPLSMAAAASPSMVPLLHPFDWRVISNTRQTRMTAWATQSEQTAPPSYARYLRIVRRMALGYSHEPYRPKPHTPPAPASSPTPSASSPKVTPSPAKSALLAPPSSSPTLVASPSIEPGGSSTPSSPSFARAGSDASAGAGNGVSFYGYGRYGSPYDDPSLPVPSAVAAAASAALLLDKSLKEFDVVGGASKEEKKFDVAIDHNASSGEHKSETKKVPVASGTSVAEATPRDWNSEFQAALEMPMGSVEMEAKRAAAIRALVDEFTARATVIGQTIIDEVRVDDAQKTIPPCAKFGGVAGGRKYFVEGIIFKFAVDQIGIFGGDEYAMAAASHELRGLATILGCNIPGIHIPLMALLDYNGYRLVATSLLPISSTSLQYGSSDGGHTVLNESAALDEKVRQIAFLLNLKGHRSGENPPPSEVARARAEGRTPSGGTLIHTCADLEGHIGHDGRFYLVDCHRLFPPLALDVPRSRAMRRGEHLYCLFRPEFVMSYPSPLSSDAYTFFGAQDREQHNPEVLLATTHLRNYVIPKFALYLVENFHGLEENLNYALLLHRFGVNMHMLGLVRAEVGALQQHYRYLRDIDGYIELRDKLRHDRIPAFRSLPAAWRAICDMVRVDQYDDVDLYHRLVAADATLVDLDQPVTINTSSNHPSEHKTHGMDMMGMTPLHYTVGYAKLQATEYLLQSGANPNVTNRDGTSPFHIAFEQVPIMGYHIIQMLLDYGADLTQVDGRDGRNGYQKAEVYHIDLSFLRIRGSGQAEKDITEDELRPKRSVEEATKIARNAGTLLTSIRSEMCIRYLKCVLRTLLRTSSSAASRERIMLRFMSQHDPQMCYQNNYWKWQWLKAGIAAKFEAAFTESEMRPSVPLADISVMDPFFVLEHARTAVRLAKPKSMMDRHSSGNDTSGGKSKSGGSSGGARAMIAGAKKSASGKLEQRASSFKPTDDIHMSMKAHGVTMRAQPTELKYRPPPSSTSVVAANSSSSSSSSGAAAATITTAAIAVNSTPTVTPVTTLTTIASPVANASVTAVVESTAAATTAVSAPVALQATAAAVVPVASVTTTTASESKTVSEEVKSTTAAASSTSPSTSGSDTKQNEAKHDASSGTIGGAGGGGVHDDHKNDDDSSATSIAHSRFNVQLRSVADRSPAFTPRLFLVQKSRGGESPTHRPPLRTGITTAVTTGDDDWADGDDNTTTDEKWETSAPVATPSVVIHASAPTTTSTVPSISAASIAATNAAASAFGIRLKSRAQSHSHPQPPSVPTPVPPAAGSTDASVTSTPSPSATTTNVEEVKQPTPSNDRHNDTSNAPTNPNPTPPTTSVSATTIESKSTMHNVDADKVDPFDPFSSSASSRPSDQPIPSIATRHTNAVRKSAPPTMSMDMRTPNIGGGGGNPYQYVIDHPLHGVDSEPTTPVAALADDLDIEAMEAPVMPSAASASSSSSFMVANVRKSAARSSDNYPSASGMRDDYGGGPELDMAMPVEGIDEDGGWNNNTDEKSTTSATVEQTGAPASSSTAMSIDLPAARTIATAIASVASVPISHNDSQWACGSCTFENAAHATVCEICSTARVVLPPIASTPTRVAAPTTAIRSASSVTSPTTTTAESTTKGSNDDGKKVNDDEKWVCGMCEVKNNSAATRCGFCESARPSATVATPVMSRADQMSADEAYAAALQQQQQEDEADERHRSMRKHKSSAYDRLGGVKGRPEHRPILRSGAGRLDRAGPVAMIGDRREPSPERAAEEIPEEAPAEVAARFMDTYQHHGDTPQSLGFDPARVWNCDQCTLENKGTVVTCEICGAARKKQTPAVVASTPTPTPTPVTTAVAMATPSPSAPAPVSTLQHATSSSSSRGGASVDEEEEWVMEEGDTEPRRVSRKPWACASCTYENTDGMSQSCGMCFTPRPQPPPSPSASAAAATPTPPPMVMESRPVARKAALQSDVPLSLSSVMQRSVTPPPPPLLPQVSPVSSVVPASTLALASPAATLLPPASPPTVMVAAAANAAAPTIVTATTSPATFSQAPNAHWSPAAAIVHQPPPSSSSPALTMSHSAPLPIMVVPAPSPAASSSSSFDAFMPSFPPQPSSLSFASSMTDVIGITSVLYGGGASSPSVVSSSSSAVAAISASQQQQQQQQLFMSMSMSMSQLSEQQLPMMQTVHMQMDTLHRWQPGVDHTVTVQSPTPPIVSTPVDATPPPPSLQLAQRPSSFYIAPVAQQPAVVPLPSNDRDDDLSMQQSAAVPNSDMDDDDDAPMIMMKSAAVAPPPSRPPMKATPTYDRRIQKSMHQPDRRPNVNANVNANANAPVRSERKEAEPPSSSASLVRLPGWNGHEMDLEGISDSDLIPAEQPSPKRPPPLSSPSSSSPIHDMPMMQKSAGIVDLNPSSRPLTRLPGYTGHEMDMPMGAADHLVMANSISIGETIHELHDDDVLDKPVKKERKGIMATVKGWLGIGTKKSSAKESKRNSTSRGMMKSSGSVGHGTDRSRQKSSGSQLDDMSSPTTLPSANNSAPVPVSPVYDLDLTNYRRDANCIYRDEQELKLKRTTVPPQQPQSQRSSNSSNVRQKSAPRKSATPRPPPSSRGANNRNRHHHDDDDENETEEAPDDDDDSSHILDAARRKRSVSMSESDRKRLATELKQRRDSDSDSDHNHRTESKKNKQSNKKSAKKKSENEKQESFVPTKVPAAPVLDLTPSRPSADSDDDTDDDTMIEQATAKREAQNHGDDDGDHVQLRICQLCERRRARVTCNICRISLCRVRTNGIKPAPIPVVNPTDGTITHVPYYCDDIVHAHVSRANHVRQPLQLRTRSTACIVAKDDTRQRKSDEGYRTMTAMGAWSLQALVSPIFLVSRDVGNSLLHQAETVLSGSMAVDACGRAIIEYDKVAAARPNDYSTISYTGQALAVKAALVKNFRSQAQQLHEEAERKWELAIQISMAQRAKYVLRQRQMAAMNRAAMSMPPRPVGLGSQSSEGLPAAVGINADLLASALPPNPAYRLWGASLLSRAIQLHQSSILVGSPPSSEEVTAHRAAVVMIESLLERAIGKLGAARQEDARDHEAVLLQARAYQVRASLYLTEIAYGLMDGYRSCMTIIPWLDQARQCMDQLPQPLSSVACLFLARILFDLARASCLVPREMLPPLPITFQPVASITGSTSTTASGVPPLTKLTSSLSSSSDNTTLSSGTPSLSAMSSTSSATSLTSPSPLSTLMTSLTFMNIESPLEATLSRGFGQSEAASPITSPVPAPSSSVLIGDQSHIGVRPPPSVLVQSAWHEWQAAESLGLEPIELAIHLLTSLECQQQPPSISVSSSPHTIPSLSSTSSSSQGAGSASIVAMAATNTSTNSIDHHAYAIRSFRVWHTALNRLRTQSEHGTHGAFGTKLLSSHWPISMVAAQTYYVRFLRWCQAHNVANPTDAPADTIGMKLTHAQYELDIEAKSLRARRAATINRQIRIGNRVKGENAGRFRWSMAVEAVDGAPLLFIDQVAFTLHQSFARSVQTPVGSLVPVHVCKNNPFKFDGEGTGTFESSITITFRPPFQNNTFETSHLVSLTHDSWTIIDFNLGDID